MEDFQPMGNSSPENIRRVRANYYGKISLIDAWVGRILDACGERGMLDDMLIAFWSDHGDMVGDHRRVFKSTFHESSIRVPLMLSWPDHFERGVKSDALAEIIDVYPTLVEALGLDAPPRVLGRSLAPALDDPRCSIRDAQLIEILHENERRVCIRTRDGKYAVRQDGEGFMLYDLEEDPREQHNLIGEESGIEGGLRDQLLRRLVGAQYSMVSGRPTPASVVPHP
jgi:arylsulfatase A-like enzyme